MAAQLWGIDLGGTKMEGVILNSVHDATPVIRTRIDTEAHKGYEHLVNQFPKLVQEMQKQSFLQAFP